MKRYSKLVSVIIPSNTVSAWLRDAVLSVASQTYENWELLVAWNNLEDQNLSTLEREFASEPRIRFIDFGNGLSLGAVRSEAVKLCRGEYIAMLDSDDTCHRTRLERQVDFLRLNSGFVAVGSQLRFVDSDGLSKAQKSRYKKVIHRGSVPLDSPVAQPAVMLRREAYFNAGGYATELAAGDEDYDLWLRLLKFGSFYNLSESLTTYRVHSNSLSHSQREGQLRGRLSSLIRFVTGEGLPFSTFDDAAKFGQHLRRLRLELRLKVLISYLTQTTALGRSNKIEFCLKVIFAPLASRQTGAI